MTEEYLALGREALSNAHPEEAMKYFMSAYELQPDNAEVIFYLGRASQDLERHEDAVRYYADVLRIEDDCMAAMLNMANSYDDLGELEKAEQCYIDASNLDPTDPAAFDEWGKFYHRQHRYDEALACLEQASRLVPHDLGYLEGRAEVLDDMERYDEEIEVLRLIVVEDPNYASAWYNLGWAYSKIGEYQCALEACKQSILLDPEDASYQRMAGFVYSEMEEYETALDYYNKARELDLDDIEVLVNKIYALIQLDRYEEALQDCDKYLAVDSDAAIWNSKGFAIFHLLDNPDGTPHTLNEAQQAYEEALKLDPEYDKAFSNLADVYMARKNYAKAEEFYMKAYNLSVSHGEMPRRGDLFAATECQCVMHRYEEAKQYLLQLLPYAEEDGLCVAYRLGFCCRQLGQYEEALQYYRLEMEMFPYDSENDNALFNIAQLEEKVGHADAAEEAWLQLIDMEEDDADKAFYRYCLGMFLAASACYDEAIGLFRIAIHDEKDTGLLADYYEALANAYVCKGLRAKALRCFAKAKLLSRK